MDGVECYEMGWRGCNIESFDGVSQKLTRGGPILGEHLV